MCDLKKHYSDNAKILKIIKWSSCVSIAEIKVFIKVCVYYQIWILGFNHIAVPIYYLFWNEILFEWAEYQQETMDLLKKTTDNSVSAKINWLL